MKIQYAGSPARGGLWFRRAGLALVGAGAVMSSLATAAATGTPRLGIHPYNIVGPKALELDKPTTTAIFKCETKAFTDPNLFCYGPGAIRKAYGVDKYIAHGFDGTGETIVIIDAFGSPTIAADLKVFDKTFGLPDPPSFKQINLGAPPFDPTNADVVGWASEVALDVQWSHAIAPGAKIILVAAASDSDADLQTALRYVIDHDLGKIVSESFGQFEAELIADGAAGFQTIADDESGYELAKQAGIQVFVSSGDSGSADTDTDPTTGLLLVTTPTVGYPGSSPNVTSVGGTNLFFGSLDAANPNGKYITEAVWNDGYGAGTGGISQIFATPDYQANHLPASTLSVLNGFRGVPDVSYNAGVVGGVLTYFGFYPKSSGFNGFYLVGGTSAGAPQWAAVSAIASQIKGAPTGPINQKLYRLNGAQARDVTAGNNSYIGVPGFIAAPSYDLTTGWGTPTDELIEELSESRHSDW